MLDSCSYTKGASTISLASARRVERGYHSMLTWLSQNNNKPVWNVALPAETRQVW